MLWCSTCSRGLSILVSIYHDLPVTVLLWVCVHRLTCHIYINVALDCEQSSAHASHKAIREGPAVSRADPCTP